MTEFSKTLLFWTLILCACSSGIISPTASSDERQSTETHSQVLNNPKIFTTVDTPNIGHPPDGSLPNTGTTTDTCAFAWENYRLEELTNLFDAALKDLNPKASGYASAFGEDCIFQDGHKVFGVIETDFYINLPVVDLADFELFGNWIAQSMSVVNSMPADMIQGPQKGFVEYKFHKTELDFVVLRVPIHVYNDSATGMAGETLFLFFYTK